jgi:hypothetical protein
MDVDMEHSSDKGKADMDEKDAEKAKAAKAAEELPYQQPPRDKAKPLFASFTPASQRQLSQMNYVVDVLHKQQAKGAATAELLLWAGSALITAGANSFAAAPPPPPQ